MASILIGAAALTHDKIKSVRAERKAAKAGASTHADAQPAAAAQERSRESKVDGHNTNGSNTAGGLEGTAGRGPPPPYKEKQ